VPIIGTSPDMIDAAEDRERFQKLLHKLDLKQPPNRAARDPAEAIRLAEEIGYPLVVRPSYVLGGRAMEIVQAQDELERYMREAVKVSNESPVLLDRFLSDAIEVDVDALSDGTDVLIGGVMEHIEQAGVHSGDSACSLPPYSIPAHVERELRKQTVALAQGLSVVGLMNVQFAIQNGVVYVLEVNPRASRTVPFVSKATGRPLAKIAARVMAGRKLADLDATVERVPPYFSVKEAVFPFGKFPDSDPILGPEMKSTGEVMGTGRTFGEAYAKSQAASGIRLPTRGVCLVSVRDRDKEGAIAFARRLAERGFDIIATQGTQAALEAAGVACRRALKVREGRPHIVDMIKNDEIDLIINTTEGKRAIRESHSIRREAELRKVTYYTTVAAALATCDALDHLEDHDVNRLQDLHRELGAA
jgi:carbamoyl-phosphate synthase large subunit